MDLFYNHKVPMVLYSPNETQSYQQSLKDYQMVLKNHLIFNRNHDQAFYQNYH